MKTMKSILTACIMVVFSLPLVAQTDGPGTLRTVDEVMKRRVVVASVVFGPTVDWMSPTTENMTKTAPNMGFRGGFLIDVDAKKTQNFYVSTGVLVKNISGEMNLNEVYNLGGNSGVMDTVGVMRSLSSYYLVLPTGIKLKTKPSRNCVFAGSLGVYHGFAIGGKSSDQFVDFVGEDYLGNPTEFNIQTKETSNTFASMYTFTPYAGIGFEYQLNNGQRASLYVQYAGQISNYFVTKATNSIDASKEKAIVHSLEFMLGFSF